MRNVCIAVLAVCVVGCERSEVRTETGGPPATRAAVARIVFVGKQDACECTRARIDAGWAALQQALGTPPRLPVERLREDTQPDEVALYRGQRPMVTLPAYYFVSADGAVVELLQGEVTAGDLEAALATTD